MYLCTDHSSLFMQPGVHSELVQRERERVSLYRQKTKAALVIQLAWRRFIRRKRQQQALLAQQKALQVSLRENWSLHATVGYCWCWFVVLQRGSEEWRRELAALVIQLAWRQHLRRRLLRQSLRRQRVLHEWTPSVLAARQRALVEKVYGGYHVTTYDC